MAQRSDKDGERQAFADRLKRAILWAGYRPTDQTQLGQLFGVSGQAVRKWLDGQNRPESSRLPAVARALGVRSAWLLDGEEPVTPDQLQVREGGVAETGGMAVSGEEVRLLLIWRSLSSEDRAAIRHLLSRLSGREPSGGAGPDTPELDPSGP